MHQRRQASETPSNALACPEEDTAGQVQKGRPVRDLRHLPRRVRRGRQAPGAQLLPRLPLQVRRPVADQVPPRLPHLQAEGVRQRRTPPRQRLVFQRGRRRRRCPEQDELPQHARVRPAAAELPRVHRAVSRVFEAEQAAGFPAVWKEQRGESEPELEFGDCQATGLRRRSTSWTSCRWTWATAFLKLQAKASEKILTLILEVSNFDLVLAYSILLKFTIFEVTHTHVSWKHRLQMRMCVKKGQSWDRAILWKNRCLYHSERTYWNQQQTCYH